MQTSSALCFAELTEQQHKHSACNVAAAKTRLCNEKRCRESLSPEWDKTVPQMSALDSEQQVNKGMLSLLIGRQFLQSLRDMCRDTRQPFPTEELSLPLCCLISRQIGMKLILISIAYLQSYAVYQSFSHCQCQSPAMPDRIGLHTVAFLMRLSQLSCTCRRDFHWQHESYTVCLPCSLHDCYECTLYAVQHQRHCTQSGPQMQ